MDDYHTLPCPVFICEAFRTKGVGCWNTGDWRIGRIYSNAKNLSLNLLIDPRWVFPGRGYSKFREGHTTFGGIAVIESYDQESSELLGRPILIGDPFREWQAIVAKHDGYKVCRAAN